MGFVGSDSELGLDLDAFATGYISAYCVYDSVGEAGDRGSASELWLKGRLCSKLTLMLGDDLDVATRAYTWASNPRR